MKKNIFILPALLVALAVPGARASDDYDSITEEELIEVYDDTMTAAADTRARIEEILTPAEPSGNLWVETPVQDQNRILNITTGVVLPRELFEMWQKILMRQRLGDCPFDTLAECKIWRSKPTVAESHTPTDPNIRDYKLTDIVETLNVTGELDTNSPVAAPLIDRYKTLMRVAKVCCTDGMVHALRRAGASDGLVYKFMVDDANFYGIGERCLMMTDSDLENEFPDESATVATISDVRNRCLCHGQQQLYDILAPFTTVWQKSPEFAKTPFTWTYTDGLNRTVTVSINHDVQNVLNQLAQCP